MNEEQDEHTTDVRLLQLMLRDARDEILRLRGDRQELRFDARHDTLPVRQHHGDAGFDLFVDDTLWLEAGKFTDIPCSVRVQPPGNVWGLIVGRSSTLRNRGLLVNIGVIDQGYRGELFAGCWNLNAENVLVRAGERIAQFIPLPLTAATLVPVIEDLDSGDRGTNGFGSTG